MANKIHYGLKNVYYAKITIGTNGNPVYATPVAMPGAVSMALNKDQEITNIGADDNDKYVQIAENNGYTGTLELLALPDSFKTDILGMTASTSTGTILESASDQASHFALLFEFSGDEKKTRHCLYNCFATKPNLESSTKGATVEAKSITMDITASKAINGEAIKYSCIESSNSVYANWFTAVQTA